MRRLIFAALTSGTFARAATAQQVPGRDLLSFPIGMIAEAAALASDAGDGLWNPASILLPRGQRARISVTALDTPPSQGVSAQTVAAVVAFPNRTAVGLSALFAGVTDVARTQNDPQTSGGDVAYNTVMVSAVAARRTQQHLVTGIAVRYRSGVLDNLRRSVVGLDGGAILDELGARHARVAVSSFLWQPADGDAHAAFNAAADLRLAGPDARREARAGYGLSVAEGLGREHYLFGTGTFGKLTGRAGVVRVVQLGEAATRLRLGVGLRYARYAVGVARDESGAGLGAAYEFTLAATL